MMKYFIIIIFTLTAFGALGFGLYKALTKDLGSGTPQPSGQQNEHTFPTTSRATTSASPTMVLTTRAGGTQNVRDIRKHTGVERQEYDVDGPYYVFYLEHNSQTRAGYQLLYEEKFQRFSVLLFGEPVGASRARALEKLADELGVKKETLCTLAISVRTVDGVRAALNDLELGIEECGGLKVSDI